jgi:hypothetical protein
VSDRPGGEPPFPDPGTDYRRHPERYRIGRGERGVFHVQPYKGELLPLWTFRTPEAARESAEALWERFEGYRAEGDFVGMDMARKYLQMGYTRAMRYAKYPGGRKRNPDGSERPPQRWADPLKREAALLFKERWDAVRTDPLYLRAKALHLAEVERQG